MKYFILFLALVHFFCTSKILPQSPGDLDTTFGIGGIVKTDIAGYIDAAYSVAIQSDDKIVLAGYSIESVFTTREITLVRYMPDGSLDNTFGTNGIVISDITSADGEAYSIAIQSDGKIVAAGYSEVAGINIENITVVRFNSDGTLDNTFGTNGVATTQISTANDVAYSVAIQTDGKIIAVGVTNQTADLVIVRHNTNGSLDNSFGSGGIVLTDILNASAIGKAVVLQEDGKILVTGGSDASILVARYDSTGTLDGTFGTNGIVLTTIGSIGDGAIGNAITIQQDGKILVAGSSNSSGNYHFTTVRYNSDGSLDNTFGSNGIRITGIGSNSAANSIALDQYGYIVVGGISSGNFALARYNTIGNLDIGFGNGGIVTTNLGNNDHGYSLVIQSDNKIVLAGESETVSDFAMARYLGFIPEITVASPNGGEDWQAGTTQLITWISNNIGDSVTIDLYKGGLFHSIITGSAPNDSLLFWTIPFNTESGSDYSIKITSINNPSVFDFSDSNFSIIGNFITVVSPNGGEEWYAGTTETITWTSNIGGIVEIELYKGGVFHSTIIHPTLNDSTYSWDISSSLTTGSDYKIKITHINGGDTYDFSDTTFSIIGKNITVTSPNGGEFWFVGSTQDITWSSNNVIDVKIELSLNNGASWLTIVDSILSTGSYSWLVNPPQVSAQSLIRISDITNENVVDQSDDVFAIDIFPNVDEEFSGIPDSYTLLQNYPNPFNPITTIYYGLPEESDVMITIYDVLGNEVMVYNEDKQSAGYHKLEFDATDYRSGVYFYRIQSDSFIETKKMILMK